MKWVLFQGQYGSYWKLTGSAFEVHKSVDPNTWDISENDNYLCSTRYIGVAKKLVERLVKAG